MKTALVTGSSGFAGRHYCTALEAAGWDVTRIDLRPSPGSSPKDARGYFFQNTFRYDLVIHCAAVVGGRKLIDGAPLALASNLELDAGLFQWALRTKPGRIVYVSSSAAYPVPFQSLTTRTMMTEDMIDPTLARGLLCAPDQLYGWTKLTGENLAYRAQQEDLNVTVIRPFSGYGEDQDDTYPFRAFAERAKARKDSFEIWGTGQQVRDFIHIDDIVAATMIMLREEITGPVNLGTGRATSMLRLARMFCTAAGYSPAIDTRPDAPSGVGYRVADVSGMREFYTPSVTLEEGVRRGLAY